MATPEKPHCIAVIDDGINEWCFNTGTLVHNISIDTTLTIIDRTDYDRYEQSHGAMCAAIIKHYVPDAPLASIKILNDEDKGGIAQLIKAIEWCIAMQIKQVNVSLGTIDYRDFDALIPVINHACAQNIIIVAACNNTDIFTYPASHAGVIGVKADRTDTLQAGTFLYNHYPADGVEITAFAKYLLPDYRNYPIDFEPSNSFAAPMISAYVYNLIKNDPGITPDRIKAHLRQKAVNAHETYAYPQLRFIPDWLDKAVIFNSGGQPSVDLADNRFRIISLNADTPGDLIRQSIAYVNTHSDVLTGRDTIIIRAPDRSSTDEADLTHCTRLHTYGKHLIYLSGFPDKTLASIAGCTKQNLWHPGGHALFYRMQKKGDYAIPLILINDMTDIHGLSLINALGTAFNNDGYNVVKASDNGDCILYRAAYFSPEHTKRAITLSCVYDTLCVTYDPDIILLGTTALPSLHIPPLLKTLKPDIFVTITDTPDTASYPESEEIIHILVTQNHQQDNFSIFNPNDHHYPAALYQRIITLFHAE